MAEPSPKVLSVREVLSQARHVLERQIGTVWVEGECSNVSAPSSGHLYFTLKDEQSQLQCAWFKGSRSQESLTPKNGMKVRAYGRVTAYERGGNVQLIIEKLEEAGLGDLQKRFLDMKERLLKEGLFDAERKLPLPTLPQRIGIVTSPTGAAIRDILNVLTRRYPDRHLLLAPVPVQGDAAAGRIARAIDYFSTTQSVDVLIVGRGGGSLEDLWPFNEEVVARSISACTIPIISAVGHETDFTISDFVADLRAPTPSAAAELVIGRKEEFEQHVERMQQRLTGALDRKRLELRHRVAQLQSHALFHEPAKVLASHRQRVTRAEDRMQRALLRRVQEPRRRLEAAKPELTHQLVNRVRDLQQHVDGLERTQHHTMQKRLQEISLILQGKRNQLQALNPGEVLRRGFSITRTAEGEVVSMEHPPEEGQEIETLLHGGKLTSSVNKVTQQD